jgi:CRISPR/Cas system endoribonuclease Cas6 (RAMP superfamily)
VETIAETNKIGISESNVQMTDWRRYSGTQDTTMNFDGMTGQITYQGEGLNNWMPLLSMGSFLHAGSTATFGLGKYSLIDC